MVIMYRGVLLIRYNHSKSIDGNGHKFRDFKVDFSAYLAVKINNK